MRKAQELSLNLIVVGALALLVLLIVGGILIFGGGDLLSGFTSIGASDEEVRITSFLSSCQSRCNTLNLMLDYDDVEADPAQYTNQLKSFCCESSDLDESGSIEENGLFGPELCSLAYDCLLDGQSPSIYCAITYTGGSFDFEDPGSIGDAATCGKN
ncbi:MAG: hypothetical protein JW791_00955 [Nanoarchaeota archaeon]|nr:hypothetical protein [Nanoarchaeota archaeon]